MQPQVRNPSSAPYLANLWQSLGAVPTVVGDAETDDRIAALVPTRPLDASPFQLGVKRAMDVVGSTVLLLLVLPLFVVVGLGVKLSSPGPVFFRQTRVGRGGRSFPMLKFRTYPVEHVDATVALPLDACPSRWGRLLRRTSIDELPQLLNVLAGHMALVGPRPERPQFAVSFAEEHAGYAERHRMPTGMTGLAQVSGLVGTTSIADRVAADNRYIDDWTIGRDLRILARTLPAVVRKRHW